MSIVFDAAHPELSHPRPGNVGDRGSRCSARSSLRDVRAQPLICATDVEMSSRWYQELLGVRSDHGGPNYERLVDGGQLVMQLHSFDVEHDHGRIGQPDDRP
jgi:hypothetical protein